MGAGAGGGRGFWLASSCLFLFLGHPISFHLTSSEPIPSHAVTSRSVSFLPLDPGPAGVVGDLGNVLFRRPRYIVGTVRGLHGGARKKGAWCDTRATGRGAYILLWGS